MTNDRDHLDEQLRRLPGFKEEALDISYMVRKLYYDIDQIFGYCFSDKLTKPHAQKQFLNKLEKFVTNTQEAGKLIPQLIEKIGGSDDE
ncbi:MAG: hypothetical protein P5672_23795 [Limnospira sp. PMC 1234.20]|uniref:hypothetical protein n=1 Tax=unclassified Limnospira TaxID=2642885 RepID=UPI0028E118F6|nr:MULTISPECIES: hypothetical protein [unclassified Limnospira]MDT9236427.1 hypothetical protein [Limnospira sp. PMC 917.15]MDT9272315.1 hypothetical protein [Limnospira sp. PMC 1234.20]MDT9272464.1 hypothetical protein [Limnospira sp. PMC 1234.20]MDT9277480.1 hypothetical protein [Limnospira sp. PMC 737.11]MDT9277894.1 hypothetical protein [Limnospira sp. PMC 737.11]